MDSWSRSLSDLINMHCSRFPSFYTAKLLKSLPNVPVDPMKSKGHIAMGVRWMGFSTDGSLLAGRDDAYPRCMWIWTMADLKLLHVIVQLENIVDSAWRPSSTSNDPPILALCCASARVYFWSSKTGVSWSDIPSNLAPFSITSLQWNDDGSQLILAGREVFCTCAVNVDGATAVLSQT
jgi:hypothetical protein